MHICTCVYIYIYIHTYGDTFLPWQTIGRHCLLLDQAVDEVLRARISRERGHSFFGVGFATDESPPASPRFAGYRFQVSYVYIPWTKDVSEWERSLEVPVSVDRVLLDFIHCPGKDGKQYWLLSKSR